MKKKKPSKKQNIIKLAIKDKQLPKDQPRQNYTYVLNAFRSCCIFLF